MLLSIPANSYTFAGIALAAILAGEYQGLLSSGLGKIDLITPLKKSFILLPILDNLAIFSALPSSLNMLVIKSKAPAIILNGNIISDLILPAKSKSLTADISNPKNSPILTTPSCNSLIGYVTKLETISPMACVRLPIKLPSPWNICLILSTIPMR